MNIAAEFIFLQVRHIASPLAATNIGEFQIFETINTNGAWPCDLFALTATPLVE